MRWKRHPAQTILVESDALHHTYSVSEPIYKTTKLAARLRHLNLQYTPVYQILFLPDAIINTDDHTSSKSSLSFYKTKKNHNYQS